MFGNIFFLIIDNKPIKDIIKFLDEYPKAAEKGRWGVLPLHYAVMLNTDKKVDLILGANPNAAKVPDENGRLPLHLAAHYNNPDVVEAVFNAHPGAAAETDNNGNLPLHIAAKNKNPEVEKLLLRATVRVIRRSLSAKIIQRAWVECRYNPAYKMCERVLERGVWESINIGDTV